MRTALKISILLLLVACNKNYPEEIRSFGDLVKPNFSDYISTFNCSLKPDQNLNSLERFMPLLVNYSNEAIGANDRIYFYFPISAEQTQVSDFIISLHHQQEYSFEAMQQLLEQLQFLQIAECNSSAPMKKLAKLQIRPSSKTNTIIEIMTCQYLKDYNFASLNLVFELLIGALAHFNFDLELIYIGDSDTQNSFQWASVFSSLEDRNSFLQDWRTTSISKEIQGALGTQSICQASRIYRSYQII